MTIQRPIAFSWFVIPLLFIVAASVVISAILPQVPDAELVAVGITLDLVVVVPALYYLVLVRGRGWPAISTVGVFVLSVLAASYIVPDERQQVLHLFQYVVPLFELALLGYAGFTIGRVIRRYRSADRPGDVYDQLRTSLRAALEVPRVADILAYEAAVIYHAAALDRSAGAERGPGAFAYHRKSGYDGVFVAILMVILIEMGAVHFLLQAWNETAMWIHLGLTLYGLLWLVGDYRAIRSRPIVVTERGMHIRCGLRWDVFVPWNRVRCIRRRFRGDVADVPNRLNAVVLGEPGYLLELDRPVPVSGPYGLRRCVSTIGFSVDDRERFETRCRVLWGEVA